MTDGEAKSISGEPSPGSVCAAYDFSDIRGIQVVGANATAQDADPARREALRLELEARANRLIQAVDQAIILANDGLIRWLGDPVARIARGQEILTPQAVILADAELPESAKEAVATRIDLWLKATTRRLLGPLFTLRELHEESTPVRGLAQKIAESLGVLDRGRVRSEVRGLDQTSRAPLRKQGVRFGAYYVYVPTLLKPASRALALQLWSLHAPQTAAESPVEKLAPLAASGRTSFPFDPLIPGDCYRVSGFRPCGERVVRVDIVERLADLIRGALASLSSGDGEAKKGGKNGFIVNGQMTSLVGCSGKTFESVLRSLGYESFEAKRSDIVSPAAAAQPCGEASENTVAPEATAAEEADISPPAEPEQEEVQIAQVSVSSYDQLSEAATSSPNPEAAPSTAQQQTEAPENECAETDTTLLWRPAPRPPRQFRLSRHRRDGGDDGHEGSSRKPRLGDQIAPGGGTDAKPLENPDSFGIGDTGTLGRRKPRAKWSRRAPRSTEKPAKVREVRGLPTEPAAQFDPTSPFAKLLELRSVLEREQKNQK